jgi:hypothetical protein
MKKIQKIPLDNGTVRLKKDAQILTIKCIDGIPYIYIIADTEAEDDFIVCIILKDDMPIMENYKHTYLGTFEARFEVYHAFSITQNK